VFIGTPRGRNSFFELWRRSQSEDGWFSFMLKACETGLIPATELALARRDLSEEQYAQEWRERLLVRRGRKSKGPLGRPKRPLECLP
jgi:hypothetical protein